MAISPAEARVLDRLSDGLSNRRIAAELALSHRTVESHLAAMYEKTGCRSRLELLLWNQQQR